MDLAMNPFASTTAPTMKTYNQELKKKKLIKLDNICQLDDKKLLTN
jgi:hypothetical protein